MRSFEKMQLLKSVFKNMLKTHAAPQHAYALTASEHPRAAPLPACSPRGVTARCTPPRKLCRSRCWKRNELILRLEAKDRA